MARGPGALSPSFSGRSGPVSELPASSRVVAESVSGGVAAPGEGPAPRAGAPGRGQQRPPGQGVGGWQTYRSEPPQGPGVCIYTRLPCDSWLGFITAPGVRSGHLTRKMPSFLWGSTHVPQGFFLGPHLGPLPPACRPWSRCSLEGGLSLCLSGGLTPPFRVPVWPRCAEPSLDSLEWTHLGPEPRLPLPAPSLPSPRFSSLPLEEGLSLLAYSEASKCACLPCLKGTLQIIEKLQPEKLLCTTFRVLITAIRGHRAWSSRALSEAGRRCGVVASHLLLLLPERSWEKSPHRRSSLLPSGPQGPAQPPSGRILQPCHLARKTVPLPAPSPEGKPCSDLPEATEEGVFPTVHGVLI